MSGATPPPAAPGGFAGLHTDQAPPLHVPVRFHLAALVAMAAAGVLLAGGTPVLGARALPGALAFTHLVTLGWLGSVMLGSIYQVVPVLAGVPVPWPRLATGVLVLWVGGVAALVTGFLTGEPRAWTLAVGALVAALVLFAVPVGLALLRAPTRSATVRGMRLALGALGLTAALGVQLALPRAGVPAGGGDLTGRLLSHAGGGALVWVGLLVAAVSWQVVPMFYLAPEPPRALTRGVVGAAAASLVALLVLQGFGAPLAGARLALLPAAVAVLGVQPVATLRAIHRRKRKRADPSLQFWQAGLVCAPVGLVLAVPTAAAADPRWAVALGWTLGVGFAGLVTHGMLYRIVPFLVWFHRHSAQVGLVPVPTMKELLPDRRASVALALHLATLASGWAALATRWPPLAPLTGLLLLGTAAMAALNLGGALRRRAPPAAG